MKLTDVLEGSHTESHLGGATTVTLRPLEPSGVKILIFSSWLPGHGHARRTLGILAEKYGRPLVVSGPGGRRTRSRAFWDHMLAKGIVDKLVRE